MRIRTLAPLGVALALVSAAGCRDKITVQNINNNENIIKLPTSPSPPPPTQPSGKPGPFGQIGEVFCAVSQTGERIISFSWTASAGAAAYVITERYSNNGGALALGETRETTMTTVTFTRRRTAWRYVYTVTAKNPSGFTVWNNGEWTAPCAVIPDATQGPPVSTAPPGDGAPPGTTAPGPSAPAACGGITQINVVKPDAFAGPTGTDTAKAECFASGTAVACPSLWWFSSDASRIQIDPNTGAMQRYQAGTTTISAQCSRTEMTPVGSRVY